MYRIRKLFFFESPNYVDWGIYFTAFIILQFPAIINFYYNDGDHNAYIRFAQALLNGDLHLAYTADQGDLAVYNGKVYLPYPPMPGLILLPFVLLFGAGVNTVAVATGMSCISLYLLHNILSRLKVDQVYFPWIIAGIIFGTGYWYALFTSHHVYAFAHITSFMFQLLVINEILERRRWWLIGIFIGCTFLTRQFTIFYALFVFGFMIYQSRVEGKKINWGRVASFVFPLGAFVLVYLFYNYLRFGNALDAGYQHIVYIGTLKERVQAHGIFSAKYVLYNLYATLIKGFNIEFEGPTHLRIKDMDLWGTSLLAASPFLLTSLKAKWPRTLRIAAWITILVILTGHLFYHNNGFEQVNTSRFTLDFLPLLVVLMALGSTRIPMWLFRGAVCYAIALNVLSYIIHMLYQ